LGPIHRMLPATADEANCHCRQAGGE